jgi:membrane protein
MKLLPFIKTGMKLYTSNNADGTAAQLAYNLILSIFPLLVCVHTMLSRLNIRANDALDWVRGIIPDSVLSLLGEHSAYIAGSAGGAMLAVALILMLTAGSAAFRSAIEIIRGIHGLTGKSGLMPFIWSFVYALGFLAVVFGALIILFVGGTLPILRYLLLFVILLILVWGLYRIAVPGTRHMLGAFLAAFGLAATGVIFTVTVASSAQYSLVYGSVSAVIFLMIWLYLCANIVIIGAVINKLTVSDK